MKTNRRTLFKTLLLAPVAAVAARFVATRSKLEPEPCEPLQGEEYTKHIQEIYDEKGFLVTIIAVRETNIRGHEVLITGRLHSNQNRLVSNLHER